MIIGIDLGTSTSEVAVFRNGRAELVRDVPGSLGGILPSVVALNAKGKIDIGHDALQQLAIRPEMVVQEVKRIMGTGRTVRLGAVEYTPQEISAFILRRLREAAERCVGESINEAVITVPANFNDHQRRATQEAAELAGLRVRRLVNEPTAAAIAYGVARPQAEERLLVYDLGGGTLDVTVLELSEGILDVLASAGIAKLGGKDFDERLIGLLEKVTAGTPEYDLSTPRAQSRLRRAAQLAKVALSTKSTTDVLVEYLGLSGTGEPLHFEWELTRADFEAAIKDLVKSSLTTLDEALAAKGLSSTDIDSVLLVGGSTRIPLVRELVSSYFPGVPIRTDVSADEAVAMGAAILGGMESGDVSSEHTVLTDVSPHTFGIAVVGDSDGEEVSDLFDPVIQKNATIPRTGITTAFTRFDFQEAVHIRVFQGEASHCGDNLLITSFHHRMAPAPSGAEVRIEMSYNLSGTIDIVVTDVATNIQTTHHWRGGPGNLSAEQKAEARRRMAEQWTGATDHPDQPIPPAPSNPAEKPWERSDLWPSVSALHHHGVSRLDRLDGPTSSKVRGLLAELEGAAARDDRNALSAAEARLTDLLFDLD
ncbi:MAG TPA: Hsp70 family protein [Gemmatimonadales bacterium]|nr:Hsp70 family protein [Gemmatimonadales bacterium]